MTSKLSRSALVATIDLIENSRNTQESIDGIYDNLCEIILNEMEIKIPKFTNKGNNKRFNNRKPYWNDQLTDLWNIKGEKRIISLATKVIRTSNLLSDGNIPKQENRLVKLSNVPNGHTKNQSPTISIL